MEFKFDATQEYQLDAIAAACGLLEGQPYAPSQLVAPKGASFQAVANRLDVDEAALLANLHAVQAARGLAPDTKLETIDAEIETVSGIRQARFANFSVEMETGTGKTYVYLRTAHELFRRFGRPKPFRRRAPGRLQAGHAGVAAPRRRRLKRNARRHRARQLLHAKATGQRSQPNSDIRRRRNWRNLGCLPIP